MVFTLVFEELVFDVESFFQMGILFINEFLQIRNAISPLLISEILLSILNILILLNIQQQHHQFFRLNIRPLVPQC